MFAKSAIKGFGSMARYAFGMYSGWYMFMQQIRKGITSVKELDAAMTELKKVTDATDSTYNNFLKSASSTASKIGSTLTEFVNATADFARLGYSIKEASGLAEVASVYTNIGDGVDSIDDATESIISTMKAFRIEAGSAVSIVDKFNEVGNRFAITSGGIGEALQRSASALYEAGNTIDESIALITTANSVVQNPETVGTALKTLSLRLRGAKTELEEASLDTDMMATSVSSLRDKLLGLTGGKVDIMINDDEFKNTTEILREMSQVWDEMTDISQAAALELMGGSENCHNVQ
jgi:TP901 family phage tail tape measure protein